MVYPALLPLMRTPWLPVVDWTDAPADLSGLVRFAERRNLVSARVPSHFKRSLPLTWGQKAFCRIWTSRPVRHSVSKDTRSSIFCDVTRPRLVVIYQRLGTTFRFHFQRTAWPPKMGPIDRTETSVNNITQPNSSVVSRVLISGNLSVLSSKTVIS